MARKGFDVAQRLGPLLLLVFSPACARGPAAASLAADAARDVAAPAAMDSAVDPLPVDQALDLPADLPMAEAALDLPETNDVVHDGEVAGCIAEGHQTQNTFGADCCPGLTVIRAGSGPPLFQFPLVTNCLIGLDSRLCSRCGNGVCEDWERNSCGCPQDCGPNCGAVNCSPAQYCLLTPPTGGGNGPGTAVCVDIAADCPDSRAIVRCKQSLACKANCADALCLCSAP
jgi:hypothetical protein